MQAIINLFWLPLLVIGAWGMWHWMDRNKLFFVVSLIFFGMGAWYITAAFLDTNI